MNKKLLIVVIVLVCLLAALFVIRANKTVEEEPETEETQTTQTQGYAIIDEDIENAKAITVEMPDQTVEYYCTDEGWFIKDVDNSVFNTNNVNFNVAALLQLYAASLITDTGENLESYGLAEPSATVSITLNDDTVVNAYLGDVTADGNYYYITNDNKNVYTIDAMNGKRICYTPFDFVNMTMDTINAQSVTIVSVVEGDKELYIVYDPDDENASENLKKSGVTTLSMKKPIENLLVYPNNLQTALLYNISGITLNSVVEIDPADWGAYGLENPVLTITLGDLENMIIVNVGNEADENNYYVKVNERNAVYTMSKSAVEPFMNYKVVDFIQKFIALHTRSDVDKITIESVYGDYTVDFRAEGENDYKDENGVTKDYRNTYINDTLIDRDTFTVFYELMTGLTFDELKTADAEGEPQAVITYELADGTKDVVHFYNYNDNFFAADKGENSQFDEKMLVSKQRVKQITDRAAELSK